MTKRNTYRNKWPLLCAALMLLTTAVCLAQPEATTAPPVCDRVRFFPRAGFAGRMAGGWFQGSNVGPTSGFVDLTTIAAAPPEGRWSELPLPNHRQFKFLRYYAPPGSHGDVAELEFYHGKAKIAGKPFGTYSEANNGGSAYDKAFDGDTRTFFDAALPDDQYAGLDLSGGGAGAAPTPARPTGAARRHYHVGNSLTDTEGEFTQAIARQAGYADDFFDRQTIPGAPLYFNWQHADGFGTSYPKAFVQDAPLTDLVMQVFIQNGDSEDATYSAKFYDAAREHSPRVRPWVYGQWAGLDTDKPAQANPPFWEAQTRAYMKVYVAHALNLERERPQAAPIRVIPGGLALLHLKQAMEAGRVPGLAHFFADTFADAIHLNGRGRYFIGLVTYSALYGRSPVGQPLVGIPGIVPDLTPPQTRAFQQVAWDTVTQFAHAPQSVADPVPAEVDARAYVGANVPFQSSAVIGFIPVGSAYDYLLNATKAGLYQVRVSAANASGSPEPLEIGLAGGVPLTVSVPPLAAGQTVADTPSVAVSLKAGLNLLRLRVPVDRPYDLNSVTISTLSRPLTHTLPTTDLYAFQPEIKAGETYTNLFSVTGGTAGAPARVTATSDAPALLPSSGIQVETGDFVGQYGDHHNRRLMITPAPGKTGKANVLVTMTGGGRTRQVGFVLTVK